MTDGSHKKAGQPDGKGQKQHMGLNNNLLFLVLKVYAFFVLKLGVFMVVVGLDWIFVFGSSMSFDFFGCVVDFIVLVGGFLFLFLF